MNNLKFIKGMIVGLLIAVGTWGVFSLVKLLLTKLLENIGITNEITQLSIIVGGIIILLILLGFGFKKTLQKII